MLIVMAGIAGAVLLEFGVYLFPILPEFLPVWWFAGCVAFGISFQLEQIEKKIDRAELEAAKRDVTRRNSA